MTNIELKYDAYRLVTVLFINSKEASLGCFGTGKEIRLRDWIDDFFPELVKKCNLGTGSECVVQFYGSRDAFEDVKTAHQKYMSQSSNIMIELPEHKPYPNNFTEIIELITKKKDNYSAKLLSKKEVSGNYSSQGNTISESDMERCFANDQRRLENLHNENIENAFSILTKAGEGLGLISDTENQSEPYEEKNNRSITDRLNSLVSTFAYTEKSDIDHAISKLENTLVEVYHCFYKNEKTGVESSTATYVKDWYEKISNEIKLFIVESRKGLQELFSSLLEKQISSLHTGYEEIFRKYAEQFTEPGVLSCEKYKAYWQFDLNETIPASCLSGLEYKTASTAVYIGNSVIKATIEKSLTNCQAYMDSVFDSAKQDFQTEMEKCKAYYIAELTDIQKTLKNGHFSKSAIEIEQELTALKNKIDCLDEIQAEINKMITG